MGISTAITVTSPALAEATHRIVVVDRRPLLIEGLTGYVRAALPTASIAYAGSSVHDAVQAALASGCHCAVVGTDGSAISTEVVTAFTMHGITALVLDERPTGQGLEAASIAGARGYLGKDVSAHEFARTLRTVLDGGSWAPLGAEPEPREHGVELSPQERRALVLYASGMTQQMVARRMGIAPSTVKHYIDRVRAKYTESGQRARTKLELHAIARAHGWLP